MRRLIWNAKSLFLAIALSFICAYFLYETVDAHASELFFSIFALLPFGAIALLVRLRSDANKLAKNSDLLTVSEQRRFSQTAKKKMRIYLCVGFLNFFSGMACMLAVLLNLPGTTFTFVLSFTVCLSALTILFSFIDDGSYSSIIQTLERRKTNAERKKELLRSFSRTQTSI